MSRHFPKLMLTAALSLSAASVSAAAQAASYMPALIGQTVGNAMSDGAAACARAWPDDYARTHVEMTMQAYVKAAAALDKRAMARISHPLQTGGFYSAAGPVPLAALGDPWLAGVRDSSGALPTLSQTKLLIGRDLVSARGEWEATIPAHGDQPQSQKVTYVADFVEGGVLRQNWRLWRIRVYRDGEARPVEPDHFCHLADLAALW